jgi:hypothetical protein
MLNNKILRCLPLGVTMILGTFAAVVHANVPKGWFLAGSSRKSLNLAWILSKRIKPMPARS